MRYLCLTYNIGVQNYSTVLIDVTRQIKEFNNLHTINLLYSTFARSKFEFVLVIWIRVRQTQLKVVENVQNKLLKHFFLHLRVKSLNDIG